MKIFVAAAAVLAVAIADNSYPAGYKAPSYPAPAYKAPAYPAPSYPAPAYKAQSYETYAPQPHSFGYEVKDEYYNNFGHQEKSDGKTTTGSYHVLLPDGRHQYVNYKADDYGYVADVTYQGEAKYDYKPAYKAPASYPAPSYPAPAYKAPEYSAPAYKAPEYSAPAYKAPATYPAPSYPAPAYKAPEYSALAYKAPAYPAKY